MKGSRLATNVLLAAALLLAAGCSSAPQTIASSTVVPANSVGPSTTATSEVFPTTSQPAGSQTITTATEPAGSTDPVVTFNTLATRGGIVYSGFCEPCHGNGGQGPNGPALWGTPDVLGTFNGATFFDNNAAAMLDFIAYFMPLFAPATLSHQQYVDVTCYILIQGKHVSPLDVFDEAHLQDIVFK